MLIVAAFAVLTLAGCASLLGFGVTDYTGTGLTFSNDTQDTIAGFIDGKQVAVVGPFVGPTKPDEIGIDGMGAMTSLPDYQVTPSVVTVHLSPGVHTITATATSGPGAGRTWSYSPHRFMGGETMIVSLQIPTAQRAPGEYFDNKMYGG
ncbi:MAG: hypothetical protein WB384_27485 [Candidatus Sulfotelmatobacter sp.]